MKKIFRRNGKVFQIKELPEKEKINSGFDEKTFIAFTFFFPNDVSMNFRSEKKAANSSSIGSPSTRHLKRMPKEGIEKITSPLVRPFFSR